MNIEGHIDVRDANRIEGWISDRDDPKARIELDLVHGERVIDRCTADHAREDLAAARIGDGRYGFRFVVPPFVPKSEHHLLGVQVRGTPLFLQYVPPPAARGETLSRFGGLWIDRVDWIDQLALRHRLGVLPDELCDSIFKFVRDGYVILPGAVSEEVVDALNADIERLWQDPPADLLIETFEPDKKLKFITARIDYRMGITKLLDVYAFSRMAREATAAPRVMAFLRAIFDETAKAFQGLYFAKGSEQAIHKDTAYVKIDSNPMHLAATWLALEDVKPGTGELTYYVGSHRAPEYLFGGTNKWLESQLEEGDRFLQSLHADAEKYRHVKSSFLGKKGDILIWHADLAHGGAKIEHPGTTRKSLVVHFTPASAEPYYRRHNRRRELVTNDCVFVSSYADIRPD